MSARSQRTLALYLDRYADSPYGDVFREVMNGDDALAGISDAMLDEFASCAVMHLDTPVWESIAEVIIAFVGDVNFELHNRVS